MLKFPAISDRRSNPSSCYLTHLTSSSHLSPSNSNQSSPRYALSPFTNHQQPRRFSLHVALRKTSDCQQPTQTNLEDVVAKPDKYKMICKSANIKQDILLETRDSRNTLKSPYIPSNNAFNLDSFIKSSEGKTTNTLSITKCVSEFEAALMADNANRKKSFKSKGMSSFAPKHEKLNDQQHDKNSKESIASLLNCSFEKGLECSNSPRSSERDRSKANSEDKLSIASAEDIPVKEPSIAQIPLARIMRRRSCCCSDCGHLSALEKKNQNLTNPTNREEMNAILIENARKELLAQQNLVKEDNSQIEESPIKEENNDAKERDDKIHESIFKNRKSFLHTHTEELLVPSPSLSPPTATDAGSESFRVASNDYIKRSDPLSNLKNRSQARRQQKSHSPKNFVVKNQNKNGATPSNTQHPLSIPLSGIITRKGSNSSILYTKIDSPTMDTEPQIDTMIGGLQQKLLKLELAGRVRSTGEHEEPKKKVGKMSTMTEAFLMKKSSDRSEKTTLPGLQKKSSKGVPIPKLNTTLGKLTIQGVYKNSSGNTTPKIYSVQQSPVNKASASLNFSKDGSPRPKICIIASQNIDLIRRGSGTGYKLTEGKEEEFRQASNKICLTTLETIDQFSGRNIKRNSLAVALQEKDEDYGKSDIEKDADKEEKTVKRFNRKKKKQGSRVEKRSLSLGMLLKAYQSNQPKIGAQTKRVIGV